jgi:hypothetical protein
MSGSRVGIKSEKDRVSAEADKVMRAAAVRTMQIYNKLL